MMRAWLLLLGLCAYPATVVANEELDKAFEKDVLVIVADAPVCYRFDVYLALNREQQRRGLMFVLSSPSGAGHGPSSMGG